MNDRSRWWFPLSVVLSVPLVGLLAAVPGGGVDGVDDVRPNRPLEIQASPSEMGQSAFSAISEMVSILEADPSTDWSKVDFLALREHLVDMNRVMMDARVTERPIEGGVEATITGEPAVMEAARRMVGAHAAMVGGGELTTEINDEGEGLQVSWTSAAPQAVDRLRALGFFGFLAEGNHHRQHHLMIVTGTNPHGGMR